MKQFGSWLVGLVSALGPWGLFLTALADSTFIPLPQGVDALLIAHSIRTPEAAWPAAALAVVGSLLGSSILYWIARLGGHAVLAKHVSAQGLAKLERQTQEYGALVLFLPMALPIPLPTKIFVIAAGVFELNWWRFVFVTLLGRGGRYLGEAYLALTYGNQTTDFLRQNAWTASGVGLALVAAFYLIHRWSSRKVSHGT